MDITLAAIVPKRSRLKNEPSEQIVAEYVKRSSRYLSCQTQLFNSEEELFKKLDSRQGRTTSYVVLLDSRGKQLSSEEFAASLERLRDSGTQDIVFAIGPADGWSSESLQRANLLLSLGRMTLPHQLARVLLAEQVYRALTILNGHPYHSGH
jgi:23S rRNA (pseudouridine1915-N3)-methyltransferase